MQYLNTRYLAASLLCSRFFDNILAIFVDKIIEQKHPSFPPPSKPRKIASMSPDCLHPSSFRQGFSNTLKPQQPDLGSPLIDRLIRLGTEQIGEVLARVFFPSFSKHFEQVRTKPKFAKIGKSDSGKLLMEEAAFKLYETQS